VPVDGGATDIRVHPDAAIVVGDQSFQVQEIVIGRSAIQVRLAYDDPGATWSLVGALRHDGATYPFVLAKFGQPGLVDVQADGGTDDPSGTWSLVVTRAYRQSGDGPEERITGPWQVDVEVP
jgi:hypothetical protein